MNLLSLAALAGATALILFGIAALKPLDRPLPGLWRLPAVVSAAFLVYSLWTVASEGPLGFWDNHVQNLWGLQVWLDLLIAVGIGFALLAREARALGMNPAPWLVLTLCTGCIGLCAFAARVLYLREGQARMHPV
ncbi:hypothetical protein KBY29_09165 [Ruegeria pomeroyi]|nr:hypothetical protein [Ruegeria pomeroyi]